MKIMYSYETFTGTPIRQKLYNKSFKFLKHQYFVKMCLWHRNWDQKHLYNYYYDAKEARV